MLRKYFLLLLPVCIWPLCLHGQSVRGDIDLIDTFFNCPDPFADTTPLDFSLTFNLKEFQLTKEEEPYIPVIFKCQMNDTLEIERPMTLRARGGFRRSNCNLSPYWLNFYDLDETDSAKQIHNRAKIVAPCKKSERYVDFLLKEYLVYRIYNILSPVSFKVRLIRIKYVDTGRRNKVDERWGFMIEPEERLAARFNAVVVKYDTLSTNQMDPETMNLLAVFEFMIGNPDYGIFGRHNVKVVGLPGFETNGYTPVPYDFDFCGIVNPPYGAHAEQLGIQSITERKFVGPCREAEDYIKTMLHIENHRDEIESLIREFYFLEEAQKEAMVEYLDEFFVLASDQSHIFTSINRSCY